LLPTKNIPTLEQAYAEIQSEAEDSNTLMQFTSGGHVLGFDKGSVLVATGSHALKVEFVNGQQVMPVSEGTKDNQDVEVDQSDKLAQGGGLGQGGIQRQSGATQLGKLTYKGVWENIDISYTSSPGGIAESTYYLNNTTEKNANVENIRLKYNRALSLDQQGNLLFTFETGNMTESAPVAWQIINGEENPIEVEFTLYSEYEVGFKLGKYTSGIPIVIDPVLTWNTFLGGSDIDSGYGVAVDSSGNVFITGYSSASWGDTDIDTSADTAKILVCASSGVTNGACNGTQLCASALTTTGLSLSCVFDDSATPIKASGNYSAYVYVIDRHNMEASGGVEGTNVGYSVNNISPVVSNVSINGGSAINLTPNATTSIDITATITNSNSCQNLAVNPVSAKAYRSPAFTAITCTSTDSKCYVIVNTSCVADAGDPCSGSTDATVKYKCTVLMQYYTDPTDGNVSTNLYYADTWKSTVTAIDQSSATGSLEGVTGVEINSLNAMQIGASIDYGLLGPNVASGLGVINIPVSITNVGNVGLNAEVAGNGSGLCTNYPTCSGGVIALSQQKWEYLNNTTNYSSGTHTLTSSLTTLSLGIKKPLLSQNPTTGSVDWGILIPSAQVIGSYSGANTINSLVSAPSSW